MKQRILLLIFKKMKSIYDEPNCQTVSSSI
jgi:hypothetical protein